MIGEQVPVKGTLPDAGSHYCRVVDPRKLQVCPSPVTLSKLLEPLSPFFFSFPEFEQADLLESTAGSPFRIRLRPRDILSRVPSMPNEVPFKPTWHGRYHQGAPIMNGSRLRSDNLCERGMVSLVLLPKIAGVGICGGKKLEQRTRLPDSDQRSFSRATQCHINMLEP